MPKKRPPYPAPFKQQILELVPSGRSIAELAREFEPSEEAIYTWIMQADRDQGKHADILSTKEREELQRLRKENHGVQQERDVLAKAAAWFVAKPSFAWETDGIPPKSSRS